MSDFHAKQKIDSLSLELVDSIQDQDSTNSEQLLQEGADPNFETSNGWRPLHYAAENNRVELIKALIKRGAVVNAPTDIMNNGTTPLHVAAAFGNIDAVKELLYFGANPLAGATLEGGAPIDNVGSSVAVKALLESAMKKSIDQISHYSLSLKNSSGIGI